MDDINIKFDFAIDRAMALTWADPDLASRPRMPLWLLPLCILSSIGALMLPPQSSREYVALPVIVAAMCALPVYTTGVLWCDFESMVVVWLLLFKCLDLMVFSRPEEEFRRVPKKWKEDDCRFEEQVKPEDLAGRAKWAVELFANHRGVGWSWRVRNVPESELAGVSKRRFLKEALFRSLFALLGAIYLASIMLSTNYYNSAETHPDIYKDSYARRTLVNYVTALVIVIGMQTQYWLFAFITTLCGITKPEDWPDLLRSPAEAFTVRRVWGVTYHQTFRRFFTLAGSTVVRLLSIAPFSLTAHITHLITGFLVSALLHHAAGTMIGQGSMGSYIFFLSQIGAILLEDTIITFFAFLGYSLTPMRRALGYAWVLLWFSLSLTPFAAGYIESGYGRSVALASNCGMDWFLPVAGLVPAGADSTIGGLLSAIVYRGSFYAVAVALLSVVRRMVIPGRPLVDRSLLGL